MSAVFLPAFAQNNSTPAVPALSAAEKQNAFAPTSPQTEPATASPKEQASVKPAAQPQNDPVSTSALTPAPVENVPVPAPAVVPPAPAETATAPDVPSSISATPKTDGAVPAKPADASATASTSPTTPDAQATPGAGPAPQLPPAVPDAAPAQATTPPAPAPAAPAPAEATTPAPATPAQAETPPVAPAPAEATTPVPATPAQAEMPPAAPAPAQAAAPAEATPANPVAVALAGKLAEIATRGPYARAVSDFYSLRGGAPLWVENDALTPVAKGLVERMGHADEDGLDASAFRVPALDALGKGDAKADADAEIAVSLAVLTYIREASSGRVDTKEIGDDIVAAPNMPDPLAGLASVAIASDPVAVLDGYNPIAPQYLALKRKLAEVRAASAANAQTPPPVVPSGPTLKVGMSDTRVALLRTRLGVTASDADSDVYDEDLQKAVRDFQVRRNLKPNGALGPSTVAALNAALRQPRVNIEDEIVANMERWRWLPHDIGTSNVMVNVPEFMVRVTKDGEMVHDAKVVVGKPDTPTPIFSDTMAFVVMNPSWNVPQSIIKKEYLPKLANDPDFLERHGFVVTYAGGQMQVRQPPGEDNALGHIKFMFPNNFSVYLHDTSMRSLFTKDKRAFSHGCVRVDNPYQFAEIVMGADNGWTADRVESLVGGKEQRIDLKDKIPVHIAYFTARVDDDGELKLFDDIYGYDKKVISALGLQG
ncbi:L,D-transpeptidase family protein [Labrys miyagiensis]|uniref:L,D-transpeptidase family protein n=1 Tax=Labrys miyagiensis TaxID=346912 RepID=UPI0024E0D1D4|nr:L,D-transpeptidase family protein [Labrys miyagiensis]